MDYRLKKIYESMLRGEYAQSKQSLAQDLHEMAAPKVPKEPKPPKIPKAPSVDVSYEEVIAHALGIDLKTQQLPVPRGNYELKGTRQIYVDAEDNNIFKKLFTVNPPKKNQEIGTAETKGSGNGEIALYWLLKKSYGNSVKDGRGAGDPDIKIMPAIAQDPATENNEDPNKPKPVLYTGVEVKSYGGDKAIGLGRFGEQHGPRGILSIVLGLKALYNSFNIESPQRVPSLDTFKAEELVSAFQALSEFDKNVDLRKMDSPLIQGIYQQIDKVKMFLSLGKEPGSFTKPKLGASRMMLTFLKEKLKSKPGFGGYMVDITAEGSKFKIDFKQIPWEETVNNLNPDLVLNQVRANGAALLVNFHKLFFSK